MFVVTVSTNAASTTALVLAVFGASAVEMVEASTLVVAAGTRSWRSALEGVGAAVIVLAALSVGIGFPLARYLPIDTVRVVVGALLLLLGLSWLRKAVLRSGGRLAKRDEDAIYQRTVASLGAASRRQAGRDGAAFLIAFKGVLLEGFEVVLIVISLGASAHRLGLAAASAAAAVVVVAAAAIAVSRQLSGVPENSLKTAVGVMLTSFGVFWVGEGVGVSWPGSDLALVALVALFSATTALLVLVLRRGAGRVESLDTSIRTVPEEMAT